MRRSRTPYYFYYVVPKTLENSILSSERSFTLKNAGQDQTCLIFCSKRKVFTCGVKIPDKQEIYTNFTLIRCFVVLCNHV